MLEGEYLNGKRHGKGKECYHDGKLMFEGEYLIGKRNGKGKEYYNDNGKLLFESEYLDGKKCGKGKEYYINDTIRFEGEYIYSFKIKGKSYLNNKIEFEGEFYIIKNGMEKDMMKMVMLYMN